MSVAGEPGGSTAKKSDLRRLAASSAWTAATTLGRVAIGAVQSVALLRLLGPDEYGRLAELASLTGLAATFCTVRAWEWLTRFLSDALSRGEAARAAAFVSLGLRTGFLVNLLGFLLVQLAAGPVCEHLLGDATLVPLARRYALLLLVSFPNDACTATLRSLEDFPTLSRLGLSTSVLRVGAVVAPAALTHDLGWVVVGYLGSEAATWLVTLAVVRARLRARIGVDVFRADASLVRGDHAAIAGYVRAGFAMDTLRGLANHLVPLLIGNARGEREVGFYRVASQLLDLAHRLVAVVSQAALPQLSTLATEGAFDRIDALVRRSSRMVAAAVVAGVGLTALLSEPAAILLGGEPYRPVGRVLAVASLGLAWGLAYFIGPLATALGEPGIAVRLIAVNTSFRVFGTALLAPALGAVGAAWAEATGAAAYVLLAWFAYGRLRLRAARAPLAATPAREVTVSERAGSERALDVQRDEAGH